MSDQKIMDQTTPHPTFEQLEAWQRRTLDPARLLEVDRHLSGCAGCRRGLLARVGAPSLPEEVRAMPEPLHLAYEQLSGYVDGTLSPGQREQVDAHTFICASCKRELGDLERFELQLSNVPVAEPVLGVSWFQRIVAFFEAPGRAREFGLAFGAIIAGIFAMLHANHAQKSGGGSGAEAQLIHLGVNAHPGFALGGLLLIVAGAAYMLHSALKK
jgi:hypothetical protein